MRFIVGCIGVMLATCPAAAQFLPLTEQEMKVLDLMSPTSEREHDKCESRRLGESTCVFTTNARRVMRVQPMKPGFAIEVKPVLPGLIRFSLVSMHCKNGQKPRSAGWCGVVDEAYLLDLDYPPNRGDLRWVAQKGAEYGQYIYGVLSSNMRTSGQPTQSVAQLRRIHY